MACLLGISVNKEGGPDQAWFQYQTASVNVKSLRELCKLTILGNAPSPDHGHNDQTEYHMPIQAGEAGTKIIEDTSEAFDGHELLDLGRCWELEGSIPNSQITDV